MIVRWIPAGSGGKAGLKPASPRKVAAERHSLKIDIISLCDIAPIVNTSTLIIQIKFTNKLSTVDLHIFHIYTYK